MWHLLYRPFYNDFIFLSFSRLQPMQSTMQSHAPCCYTPGGICFQEQLSALWPLASVHPSGTNGTLLEENKEVSIGINMNVYKQLLVLRTVTKILSYLQVNKSVLPQFCGGWPKNKSPGLVTKASLSLRARAVARELSFSYIVSLTPVPTGDIARARWRLNMLWVTFQERSLKL